MLRVVTGGMVEVEVEVDMKCNGGGGGVEEVAGSAVDIWLGKEFLSSDIEDKFKGPGIHAGSLV